MEDIETADGFDVSLVEPWLAAVLMPLSSVATISLTTFALREDRTWTS